MFRITLCTINVTTNNEIKVLLQYKRSYLWLKTSYSVHLYNEQPPQSLSHSYKVHRRSVNKTMPRAIKSGFNSEVVWIARSKTRYMWCMELKIGGLNSRLVFIFIYSVVLLEELSAEVFRIQTRFHGNV